MYPPTELYACLALLVAISTLVGWAIYCACGRAWSWLAPAVGLAALVIVAGATIRLPGGTTTSAVVIAAMALGSAAVLWRRRPAGPPFAPAAAIAIAVLLAASLPFLAAGGFGAFTGKSNDLGYYLYDAQWLQTGAGFEPGQIVLGYPMGPPALVAVTADVAGGASLVATFTALMIAIAVAGGLASLELVAALPAGRRALAGFLVGLPYMVASFYVQASFKEMAMGLFVLAFALALRDLVTTLRRGDESATTLAAVVPMALLATAGVYTYSFAGTYWVVATLGVFAVGCMIAWRGQLQGWVRSRRWGLPRTRRSRVIAVACLLVLAAVVIPEWGQVSEFARSRGSLGALNGGDSAGDLPGMPWFYTVLGVWPVTDYRATPPSMLVERLLFAIALIFFLRGALGLWRRRELAILSAGAAGGLVYLAARWGSGPYVQSKALAVMAPVTMLIALYGLFASGVPSRRARRLLLRAAGVVFAAGALFSTYLALAGAFVNTGEQARQLESLGRMTQGSTVLFLGSDDYIGWELRGAGVLGSDEHSGVFLLNRRPGRPQIWPRYDFDSLAPKDLDVARYVIASRGPFQSEAPSNFRRVAATQSFVLWRRQGPTARRGTLLEGVLPGQILQCGVPSGRALSRRPGVARIWPTPPVLGPYEAWAPSSTAPPAAGFGDLFRTALVPGRSFSQSLELPAGRWAISMQYSSVAPLVLSAPGLERRLPPNYQRPGSFWPVGTIDVSSRGSVPFGVELAELPGLRDLLAGPHGLDTRYFGIVAGLAATRIGERPVTVPLARACGRFVDWYRLR